MVVRSHPSTRWTPFTIIYMQQPNMVTAINSPVVFDLTHQDNKGYVAFLLYL